MISEQCLSYSPSCKGDIVRYHCSFHSQVLSNLYSKANEINVMSIIKRNEYELRARSFDQLQGDMSVLYESYRRRIKCREYGFSYSNWNETYDYLLGRVVEYIFLIDNIIRDYNSYKLSKLDVFQVTNTSYLITRRIYTTELKWNSKFQMINTYKELDNLTYSLLEKLISRLGSEIFITILINAYDVYELGEPVKIRQPHEIRNVHLIISRILSSLEYNSYVNRNYEEVTSILVVHIEDTISISFHDNNIYWNL